MDTKLQKKLLNGRVSQIKGDAIVSVIHNFPNLSRENVKKLEKAYRSGKGCRIQLMEHEIGGSGFASMAKKGLKSGAKFVKNNKQLSALKDQAIDRGLNYAVSKAGLDENTGNLVKGLAKNVVNKQFDNLAGGNVFNKNLGRKILKTGAKALKVGNKISNAMGYDDIQDMGIDIVANETLGRIDPTLGRMAGNAMKKVADKKIEQYAGGAVNPFLPKSLRGGALRDYAVPVHSNLTRYNTYDDLSNLVRPDTHAFNPKASNLPMYDVLKMHRGAGFTVH